MPKILLSISKSLLYISIKKVSNHITTLLNSLHILNIHCSLHLPLCFNSSQVNTNNGYHQWPTESQALFKMLHGLSFETYQHSKIDILKDNETEAQKDSTNCKDHKACK